MRVPHRKTYKNDRYDVIKQKFEKMKKVSSQIFVKIICVHFHQNRTKIVETIHPDGQPDEQPGLILRIKIFSPEMTE